MANYLISNGILLDATGADAKSDSAVFVEDNKIAKVDRTDKVEAFARK